MQIFFLLKGCNIMDLFKNLASAFVGAKDIMVEKNRRTALINRLRTVIKCEEQSSDRAFMALGRYYYHNLRDVGNSVTEPHCADIDEAQKKLENALKHLEELYNEESDKSTVEEITLEDVMEISVDDQVEDGFIDEAAASPEPETAKDGENDNLPFE